jgi:hypothetical protein
MTDVILIAAIIAFFAAAALIVRLLDGMIESSRPAGEDPGTDEEDLTAELTPGART